MQKVAKVMPVGIEMVLKRELHRDKALPQPQGGISSSCFGKRKDEQQPTAPLPALTFKVFRQRFLLYSRGKKTQTKNQTKKTPVSLSHIKNKKYISVG